MAYELTTVEIVTGTIVFLLIIAVAIFYKPQLNLKKKQKEQSEQFTESKEQQRKAEALEIERRYNAHQAILFPNMKGIINNSEELDKRVASLHNIAQRIKVEQTQISSESDQLLDNLDVYVEKMKSLKEQYIDLADLIDTQFQIIEFELDAKDRILNYHKKNKVRRKNLPQELAEIQKSEQKQEESNNTFKNRPIP